ncbi:anchored repeat ABC transporter, substrate-binding protein [Conexibacter sp. CPCC 206217]|uniref:anchored repeat ABC transporter, substrate-binding protein n=1 Tax=Conexibacter sp. CPCC 206217 TaxID=3064574 RepID=UPI00271BD712|nr:anchored repeat ABC transporter, substrate-binding protein [Conexibacter sp. CPCC 206217]MDO8213120.1 anchored repeat ABC transporter, substrate-binding protein [Conexibacter sp. CPCC 206217]
MRPTPNTRELLRAAFSARMCALALLASLGLLSGCGAAAGLSTSDGRLQVITTTGLLRDLVKNVGGDRVNVVSLVPDRGDPHSFEPTLRDVRDVVYADVAFSNYMLLEQHSIVTTLDANLGDGVPNVSLAEDAVKYAAEIIPLVEDVNLDTVWLGLRARGDGAQYGADRSSDVLLAATAASGPGDVFGYLTGTFGEAEVYFNSRDGFDAASGFKDDTATLPADAHTHMSWVFTEPGLYRVTFAASLQVDDTSRPISLGDATFTFAVGVKPPSTADATVLDQGHADLTVDLDRDELYVLYDPQGGGEQTQIEYGAEAAVIEVPSKAISEIPAGAQFRFMGKAGEQIYQLPQAVLGKHVHGEIDPHLWQDVRNAMSYTELIRDTLIDADPAGAKEYRANAAAYLAELDRLDRYVRRTIAAIPSDRRYLVTTHDAFAYLAHAYGVKIAGFVTPNPAVEPSLSQRRKLTETIRNLQVPAVFLEPNLAARSSTLTEVAKQQGIRVCPIYGDTFDGHVTSYVQMMRFNADSLKGCLS